MAKVRANVSWCWNRHYIYDLETGKALLFSSPGSGGDGSWRSYSSWKGARRAADCGLTRHHGIVELETSFIERVREAGTLIPSEGEGPLYSGPYYGYEAHQASIVTDLDY